MPNLSQSEWSGRHSDKDRLRIEVWSRLKEQQVSLRDPFGHIPNFVGAEQASDRLAALPIWQQATVIKCNPDSPKRRYDCARCKMANGCTWLCLA